MGTQEMILVGQYDDESAVVSSNTIFIEQRLNHTIDIFILIQKEKGATRTTLGHNRLNINQLTVVPSLKMGLL